MLLRKKEEIEKWLKKYEITNYELIENKEYGYIVNVNSDVNLFNKNVHQFEVKFNEVKGFFNCSYNKLTALEGCPKIVHGDFYCYGNKLTIEGLKYLPKEIKTNYINIRMNEKLSDLQNINNINELKEKLEEIFKIKEEKENLLDLIKKDLNNNYNKTNKI